MVMRGRDAQHDRLVALKVLAAGAGVDRDPLLAEARALLALRPHAGLPIVRDDFFNDDQYVLVMDWIEGEDLQEAVEARGDPGLAPTVALEYLAQLAAALDHLHSHRPPI